MKRFIENVRWFTKESKSYMEYGTHTTKLSFWLRYPRALIGYMILMRRDAR